MGGIARTLDYLPKDDPARVKYVTQLKEMAVRELDVPDWSLSKADMARLRYLPVGRVARYCGKDGWHTLQLVRRLSRGRR